jgi:hypothetical protein
MLRQLGDRFPVPELVEHDVRGRILLRGYRPDSVDLGAPSRGPLPGPRPLAHSVMRSRGRVVPLAT